MTTKDHADQAAVVAAVVATAEGRTRKTAAGWSPLAAIRDAPAAMPVEPPVGSVIAWINGNGFSNSAVHGTTNEWWVTGADDPMSWQTLVDMITSVPGLSGNECWAAAGIAVGWTPLSEYSPLPDTA